MKAKLPCYWQGGLCPRDGCLTCGAGLSHTCLSGLPLVMQPEFVTGMLWVSASSSNTTSDASQCLLSTVSTQDYTKISYKYIVFTHKTSTEYPLLLYSFYEETVI